MKGNDLLKFFGIFVFCLLLVISIAAQNTTNFSESDEDLDENGTEEEILDEEVNENPEENESEEKEENETSEEELIGEGNESEEIILEKNESYEERNNSGNSSLEINESLEEDFENNLNESFGNESLDNESEEINNSENEKREVSSGSGSSSNYVGIEEFEKNESEEINNSNGSEEDSNSEGKRERTHIYYSEGSGKEIELKSFEEDVPKIMKEEFEKDEFSKEVRVSSDEHVDSPLRVYSSLKTEAKKEEIKIFWKNENREVTLDEFDVEYYDKNDNGLIDRISWVVPHLSEQVFDIEIIFSGEGSSSEINLTVDAPEGEVNNPIIFDVGVNYTGEVDCSLEIGGTKKDFKEDGKIEFNLEDGTYDWEVYCEDGTDSSINKSKNGSFEISEEFNISGVQDFYLLDLVNNELYGSVPEIYLSSKHDSNMTIVLERNDQTILNNYVENENNFMINLNSTVLNKPGNYNLTVGFNSSSGARKSISKEFNVASAEILVGKNNISVGEHSEIIVNISSPIAINFFSIDFGDGKNPSPKTPNSFDFYEEYSHEYEFEDVFTLEIFFGINNNYFTITKNGITVTEPEEENDPEETEEEDNEDPEIDLVFPEDGAVINKDNIEFKFKVNDSSKVDLCEFRLYNASDDSWSYTSEDLVYNDSTTNVPKNKDIKIPLTKFDERRYAWEVECIDEFENDYLEWGYFEVNFNASSTGDVDYEKKEVIESLISDANDFLDKEDDWSAEEKKALEDLGILSDLKTDKKNLVNIQKYFKGGENSVGTQDVKAKLKEDYLKDIEEIGKRMPAHFEIVDSYEFVKNSIDSDFKSIIDDYLESTNTQISKSSKRKLSDFNSKLQQDISVSTEVKEIRIEYEDSEKTIMLVNKEVGISNDEYGRILEVIPKEIAESAEEINFVVESKVIKDDPIFEIFYEDLDDGEMVYFIEKSIDVEDFENTQTVLFEDKLADRGNGITGFLSLEFSGSSEPVTFIVFFLLAIVFIALVIFVGKKFRMYLWKKDPNVERATEYISDIKKAIKKNEIENAREIYYKLRKTYPVLPEKTKSYFYKEIKRVFGEIDKKDIFGMVKEYEEAKREFRKDDAVGLYKDIKKVYERLPKKYKEKVHERITR